MPRAGTDPGSGGVGSGAPRRVLVTGGAGFIGANLCRALSADDHVAEVVVIDDLSTGSAENLVGVPRLALHEASILAPEDLDRAMEGVDAVVHLAARAS